MVRSHVADRVARGLDCVQANLTQGIKHIWNIAQFGPVILDVLACGEVAVAFVPFLGEKCELPHLSGIQRAIRDRDPQHVGVELQIQTVHQAQGLEFIFCLLYTSDAADE